MVQVVKTLDEFKELASSNKLIAVDAFAEWCGPCKMIGPKFAAMADEFKDILFLKVDVDENEEFASEYGIQAMPTFFFFKDGEKVDDLVGANEAALRKKLQALAAQK